MDETKARERWYVTTDFFRNGGQAVSANGVHVLGPYNTREEALACREGFEHGARMQGRLYVDQLT